MTPSDLSDPKIPVHELEQRDLKTFDYKIYHLKGSYSQERSLPSMPGDTEKPHRHKYHEICFFSTGEGVHEVDFKKIKIQPNSIHFVAAGQVHLISSSQDVTGRVLAFSPGFLWDNANERKSATQRYPFINPINNVQNLDLSTEEFQTIIKSVEHLNEDGKEWKVRSGRIIQQYIKIILEKCMYFISKSYVDDPESSPLEDNIISKYKNLVEDHFRKNHQVQDYSQMLNISPGHLNRYCKEQSGMTASEIILDRLILEAKRLLLFTDKSSKRIAYHLNFEDPSYFSRFFRKKTGYSPLRFRKLMRDKYHH